MSFYVFTNLMYSHGKPDSLIQTNPTKGTNPKIKYLFNINIMLFRYLANQFGLAGKTNMERAQADEIVDAVNDMIEKRVEAMRETDERKKSSLTREFMSDVIPKTMVS